MSIEKLFDTDRFDRDDYFNEKWDEWTRDDLLTIVEKANLDEDAVVIGSIACHPLSTVDDLKSFALSGKFGVGVIKSVLMNENCTEEIIRGLYDRTPDDKIFDFVKEDTIKEYGDEAYNEYSESYINSINTIAKDHKNFPDDLK